MIEPIVLDEYDSKTTTLTSEQVLALRAAVGRRLTVTAADAPGDWIVKATSYVGTVVAGGVRVLVRPKVSNANLFHLLEAGGEALDVRPEAFEYGQTADLVPSFSTFFARIVETAFARGIHRAYEEREVVLSGIRGRVDLNAQQRRLGLPIPVACRFDEYTGDVPLNRIIKAAAEVLSRVRGVTSTTRSALAAILSRLEEVSPLHGPELYVPTVFTRLNHHLRPAERLARMVLRGSSLVDQWGDAEAGAFLVNMNRVFEEFVAARLRTYLAGRLVVDVQHHAWLDTGHEVVQIVPDVVIRDGGRPVFVGDAKYKLLHDEEKGRNPDYYQLLAYATALNVPEGVLVYCHHDGMAPEPIEVVHAGTRIFVRGINLDGRPSDVDNQVQSLAAWISARCAARLSATAGAT